MTSLQEAESQLQQLEQVRQQLLDRIRERENMRDEAMQNRDRLSQQASEVRITFLLKGMHSESAEGTFAFTIASEEHAYLWKM